MTKGLVAMTAIKWLATLGVALILPAAHATTAIVFSESTGRWGVAWNESGKDGAIRKAIEDCRYRGGGKDCKPLRVTDEAGHGAVAQTCAGGFCGISVITGRRSAADAERDVVRDCNKQYGVNNCYALDRWYETSPASVAKAPPPNSAPQQKPSPPMPKLPDQSEEADRYYAMGLGIAAVGGDAKEAAALFDKACTLGQAKTCVFLAKMYARGESVRQDFQKAAQVLEKACGLGNGEGCFGLGLMYTEGHGVRQDSKKAVQLFDKACGLEYADGCKNAEIVRSRR